MEKLSAEEALKDSKRKVGSMSKTEIANLYEVSLKTLRYWVKEKGLMDKILWKATYLPPSDVDLIIKELGNPYSLYSCINRE